MSQFISGLSQSEKFEREMVVKLNGIQIETFRKGSIKTLKRIEFIFVLIGLGRTHSSTII
jgi:hypothetical protein